MSDRQSDPRVYFAAERTMLAWMRTGLAIMALGFVVARFSLFVKLSGADTAPSDGLSVYIGVVLVTLGVIATAGGSIQFWRFFRTVPLLDRPTPSAATFGLIMSGVLSVVGLLLCFVLLRR